MTIRARPGLYRCVLIHERLEGARHRFEYVLPLRLVDLDDLPRAPWPLRALLLPRAADHLGDPRQSIKTNLEEFLRLHDVEPPGGRILLLAQVSAAGPAFDPLSVYWCHDRDGELRLVVAEVRNTFGERYCYLLRPDVSGRAEIAKAFYVSPMFPLDGRYRMRFGLEADRLLVVMTLVRPDGLRTIGEHPALVVTLRGRLLRNPMVRLLALVLRQRTGRHILTLIHHQSRLLRGKGLTIRRRRPHQAQPGVQWPTR